MQQTGGIFQAGPSGNFLIHGGEFVQHNHAPNVHNCYDADDGFKHLQAHVAPTAYASQQDGDAPKCHPNTRTAILSAIMEWVLVATMGLQWILWVNGAAGAGKSAIARSVVDLCLQREIVVVRFFFFRTDPTRNSNKPVVATLAYQLIQSIPALDSIMTPKIRSNPLIFQESLETQFKVLIFESLRQLHEESPFAKPVVFLVDGVDECAGYENQANLIHTIAEFVAEKSVPLIAIFSSRTELQLQMAFNIPKVDGILRRLPLDTDYRAAEDIRIFLDDSFSKIKTTHPFRSSIDPAWPAPPLVQEIVNKSSNQFVYASVVVKFISSPRLHPVRQLDIVRGLRPAGELTPFAQLDALYRHIFSQIQDITHVTAILAVAILSNIPEHWHICEILDVVDDDIDIALADLTSVVSHEDTRITFLHASLPDFLLDQSRAQKYYIDKGVWCEQFAVTFMSKSLRNLHMLTVYLGLAKCTPRLRETLYRFHLPDHPYYLDDFSEILYYITTVHHMDFGDEGELYRHHLNLIVRHMDKHDPDAIQHLGERHEIAWILADISNEKKAADREKTDLPVEEKTPKKASFSVRSKSRLARFLRKQ
ncbi:hypothetical protein HYPSUDRAFT_43221 [Hypholoma sublateritium FD-334 SS-4]|uniref:Nephrocystin 3-like N-terminal domain-containing protein n=1 Tax=Hypholoma sublateritium (strain FD-334 SS-4) TaxID=945553 RepID=A0A0D2PK28_HYPSF|nr:hypothetical protein HYPSUDRAFT_43221 [Hypholoma sublateritium FD-334 SS-4]